MTALHPTFDHIVSSWQRQAVSAGTPPVPEFTEGLRLVIEVEATEANRELLRQIEALACADKVNASVVGYEDGVTAYCSTCHEAMPYFHTEYHNCLKEAN